MIKMFLREGVVTFLFLIALSTPAHQRIIHIPPDGQPFTQCPVEDCYSFTALINNDLLLGNISNTTIIFQSGTHTISSAINRVISISSVTNLTLRAADTSTGATVKCNGTIRFAFSYISGLNISGISFDQCGTLTTLNYSDATSTDMEMFSLSIAYSCNVTIRAVTISRGQGNGLLVRCVYGKFVLSQANLTMNNINLNVFIGDEENISPTSITTITIMDSVLSYGQLTAPFCRYSSGIILRSLFEKINFLVEVKLVNITSHDNLNCYDDCDNNMYIEINIKYCTTSLTIEDYTSTYDTANRPKHNKCSTSDTGLVLRLNRKYDAVRLVNDECLTNSLTIKNTRFSKSGVYILTLGFDTEFNIYFCNILIEDAHTGIDIEPKLGCDYHDDDDDDGLIDLSLDLSLIHI